MATPLDEAPHSLICQVLTPLLWSRQSILYPTVSGVFKTHPVCFFCFQRLHCHTRNKSQTHSQDTQALPPPNLICPSLTFGLNASPHRTFFCSVDKPSSATSAPLHQPFPSVQNQKKKNLLPSLFQDWVCLIIQVSTYTSPSHILYKGIPLLHSIPCLIFLNYLKFLCIC